MRESGEEIEVLKTIARWQRSSRCRGGGSGCRRRRSATSSLGWVPIPLGWRGNCGQF